MFARNLLASWAEVAVAFVPRADAAGDTRVAAEYCEGDGWPRRLDEACGLFPLLRTMSPLLLDAPPKASSAPSSAALLFAMSLLLWWLLAVDGARDGVLCEPDMPQRATGRYQRVDVSHRIQQRQSEWSAGHVGGRAPSGLSIRFQADVRANRQGSRRC